MKLYEAHSRPRWKDHVLDNRLLCTLIIAFGLGTAVVLAKFAGSIRSIGTFQCAPDGTLILPDQTLRPSWDGKYFFSITLAWGEFDLGTAKMIDIFWDLVIGRGGQLLLSILAFSVVRRSTWTSMERTPWHLPVLTRLTLDPVSFTGLWASLKEGREASSATTLVVIFIVAYILAFSTAISAMSGYRSRMEPSYPQCEGATTPLNNGKLTRKYPLELVYITSPDEQPGVCPMPVEPDNHCVSNAFYGCVVPPGGACYDAWKRYSEVYSSCTALDGHGGWGGSGYRIPSESDSYPVMASSLIGIARRAVSSTANSSVTSTAASRSSPFVSMIELFPVTASDGSISGFATTSATGPSGSETTEAATNSTRTGVVYETGSCKTNDTLPPVFIDWAAYDDGRYYMTATNLSIDGRTYHLDAPLVEVWHWDEDYYHYFGNSSFPRYYHDADTGLLLNSTWLRQNSVCQPDKTYQWGFSAVMLFTFSIFTTIFGVALLNLSWLGRRRSHKRQPPEYFSVYRDVLDLALEIKKEIGDSAESLSARRLDTYITTSTGKVQIEEDVLLTSRFPDDKKPPSSDHGSRSLLPSLRHLYPSTRRKFRIRQGRSRDEDKALIGNIDADKSSVSSTAYHGEGDRAMSGALL